MVMGGKIITIDWNIVSELPDDEYQVKLLSKRQAAILLALCEYQHWQTRWDNLELSQQELDRMMGDIEFRLMGNEDGGMVTKAELIEGICEGMQCYTENIAKRIISGVTGGITIDDDGNVTIGGGGAVEPELPEDDPATPVDESQAAKSGGAGGVRLGYNAIWTNMNAWSSAGLSATDTKARLKVLYQVNEAETDIFVDQYYADKAGSLPLPTAWATTLDSYMFCKGATVSNVARFVFEQVLANVQAISLKLVNAVSQAQINAWFEQGSEIPSTDYVSYSCVPIDPETFVLDDAYLSTGVYKAGASIGKLKHRIRIDVSGKINHPTNGGYQDFFYFVASNGTKTFLGLSGGFGTIQFNAPFGNPPQTKVPWESSGVYSITMETTSAAAYAFRRVIQVADKVAGSAGFTITFTDLGEILD
jgi:hypothetical protein